MSSRRQSASRGFRATKGNSPSPGSAQSTRAKPAAAASAHGHHLNQITIQARPDTAEAVAAPAHVSALASPGTAPIQLASWWKKGLAGLAAVGGGVAAGLGGAALAGVGLAMAPALALGLAIGGGAALLGGAGYLGYQAWRSRRRGQAPQERQPLLDNSQEPEPPQPAPARQLYQSLMDDRRQLANAPRGSRQELLHNILDEGLSTVERGHAELSDETPDHGGGDTQRIDGQRGRYLVRVGTEVRNPAVRPGFLLHELIHASADMSYPANAEPNREFLNIDPPDEPAHWDQHLEAEGRRIGGRNGLADQLYLAAETDRHLTHGQKQHIFRRAGYISAGRGANELDTVATDLLYFAHKEGIPEESPAHQFIVRLAREAYERRRAARNG